MARRASAKVSALLEIERASKAYRRAVHDGEDQEALDRLEACVTGAIAIWLQASSTQTSIAAPGGDSKGDALVSVLDAAHRVAQSQISGGDRMGLDISALRDAMATWRKVPWPWEAD